MCKNHQKGRLFIVSAPSGAGKTTLCQALLNHFKDIRYSISHTTRAPRTGEQNGAAYYFTSQAEFIKGIEANFWAEWAEVHGHYYGTSRQVLDDAINSGQDLLLDIDVQGMAQIIKYYPESKSIFIMAPSLDALKNRLEKRKTDSPQVIACRLENAKSEIACKEHYNHVIINDDLKIAVSEFIDIVAKYRGEQ